MPVFSNIVCDRSFDYCSKELAGFLLYCYCPLPLNTARTNHLVCAAWHCYHDEHHRMNDILQRIHMNSRFVSHTVNGNMFCIFLSNTRCWPLSICKMHKPKQKKSIGLINCFNTIAKRAEKLTHQFRGSSDFLLYVYDGKTEHYTFFAGVIAWLQTRTEKL